MELFFGLLVLAEHFVATSCEYFTTERVDADEYLIRVDFPTEHRTRILLELELRVLLCGIGRHDTHEQEASDDEQHRRPALADNLLLRGVPGDGVDGHRQLHVAHDGEGRHGDEIHLWRLSRTDGHQRLQGIDANVGDRFVLEQFDASLQDRLSDVGHVVDTHHSHLRPHDQHLVVVRKIATCHLPQGREGRQDVTLHDVPKGYVP